jgi:hypothetical protein
MSRLVGLVRTDVFEERSASIIRVTRIGELGTTLAVANDYSTLLTLLVTANVVSSLLILVTLMMEELRSSKTSIFQKPQGVTPLKTVFFILTELKSSNLTSSRPNLRFCELQTGCVTKLRTFSQLVLKYRCK